MNKLSMVIVINNELSMTRIRALAKLINENTLSVSDQLSIDVVFEDGGIC